LGCRLVCTPSMETVSLRFCKNHVSQGGQVCQNEFASMCKLCLSLAMLIWACVNQSVHCVSLRRVHQKICFAAMVSGSLEARLCTGCLKKPLAPAMYDLVVTCYTRQAVCTRVLCQWNVPGQGGPGLSSSGSLFTGATALPCTHNRACSPRSVTYHGRRCSMNIASSLTQPSILDMYFTHADHMPCRWPGILP
jgi:hypothetical protein